MQIKANLGSFNAVWAVVVHRVRGGFDRDAFAGINLGKSRAIDAGSIIVTGGAERGGARPPALHIAAAAPDAAAVPVRLPPLATPDARRLPRPRRPLRAGGAGPAAAHGAGRDPAGASGTARRHRARTDAAGRAHEGAPRRPAARLHGGAHLGRRPGRAGRAGAPPRRRRRARVHAGDGAGRERPEHALRVGHAVGARRGRERRRRAVGEDPQGSAGAAAPGRRSGAGGRTPRPPPARDGP